MDDHYAVLGVARNVDVATLRRCYNKLAVKFHPDKNKDPEAEEKFRKIAEAFAILSDKEKRSLYDEELALQEELRSAGLGDSAASELLNALENHNWFGDFAEPDVDAMPSWATPGVQQQTAAAPSNDLHITMALTLEDLWNGGSRELSYTRRVRCKSCRSAGCESCLDKGCQPHHASVTLPICLSDTQTLEALGDEDRDPNAPTGSLHVRPRALPHGLYRRCAATGNILYSKTVSESFASRKLRFALPALTSDLDWWHFEIGAPLLHERLYATSELGNRELAVQILIVEDNHSFAEGCAVEEHSEHDTIIITLHPLPLHRESEFA